MPVTVVAALALGVPAVLFALWPLLRGRPDPAASVLDGERAELEAGKAAALQALRELAFDHQAGHLAEADHAELRTRYEARAAAILKRLDALGPAPVRAKPARVVAAPARVPWSRRPVVLGAGAAGLLGFGLVLGLLVSRFSAPQPPGPQATASGSPMAGMMPPGGAESAPMAPSVGTGRPIAPGMLQGMLQAARSSLEAGRYPEAIAAYKAILKREPANVDAITHLGLILAIAGHADTALDAFDKALSIDPDYPEALWYKAGVLYTEKQDYAGAIGAWERFLKKAPPGPDRDQAVARITEAKTRLAAAPASPSAPAKGAASR